MGVYNKQNLEFQRMSKVTDFIRRFSNKSACGKINNDRKTKVRSVVPIFKKPNSINVKLDCPKSSLVSDLIWLIFPGAHLMSKGPESVCRQTLGHPICYILGCRYFLKANRTKWYRTSMWFKALWWIGFLDKVTTPWLSLYTTGVESVLACRDMRVSQPRHKASLAALDAATYSLSVVDVVLHSCSFEFHEIAP